MSEKELGAKKDAIPQPDGEMLGKLVKAIQERVTWMQVQVIGGRWEPDEEHGKDGVGRLQISVRCGRCNVAGNGTSAMDLNTPNWGEKFVGPLEKEIRDWWLDSHHLLADAGKVLSGGPPRPR